MRRVKWITVATAALGTGGLALWIHLDPPPEVSPRTLPATLVMTDRHGTPFREHRRRSGERCLPVPLEAISPAMRTAMIATEDKRFPTHAGVDPLAIIRAAVHNVRYGRVVSGASTLTWQLVRMVHPRPRTLRNKLREASWALRIERNQSKDEILEHYLNRAPFGGTIHGVEAAARTYFDKPASALDWAEAALLAGVPQSPARFRPDRRMDNALQRREYVIGRLSTDHPDRLRDAPRLRDIPQAGHQPAPFLGPHFGDMLIASRPAPSGSGPMVTTLDLVMQRAAEQAAAPYANRLRSDGIDSMAVVIIDVDQAAVRVLIGSPDYDAPQSGQINGALAARSPGSTLKPFIYTEAFDRGLITPATMLNDTPARFRHYAPANFDRQFRGSVTARDALSFSLNMPALELVRQIDTERLYNRLREVGLGQNWQAPDHYGLTIAIGTAGTTLLDLVNAYAALAREGAYLPYRVLEDEPVATPRQLWHPAAVYMTTQILLDAAWQNGATDAHHDARGVPFALKTGTSNGFRDAWAVAYNPEFAVGVWIGRSDGAGHADLIGAQTAVPVCTAVFRTLYRENGPWFSPPAGLAMQETCTASGSPPATHCLNRQTTPCLPGVSPARPCETCRATGMM